MVLPSSNTISLNQPMQSENLSHWRSWRLLQQTAGSERCSHHRAERLRAKASSLSFPQPPLKGRIQKALIKICFLSFLLWMSEPYIVERIEGGRIAEKLARAFPCSHSAFRAFVLFANLFSAQTKPFWINLALRLCCLLFTRRAPRDNVWRVVFDVFDTAWDFGGNFFLGTICLVFAIVWN